MANKAIEILKKAEHDLDIEIKMWKNQGRPEVATRCKIEKAQVKQAIEKLSALAENPSSEPDKALGLFGVRLSLPIRPDFSGDICQEHVKVDIEDLKKCGWDYAKKWLEEVREEKYQWANAFNNLKRALESNEA